MLDVCVCVCVSGVHLCVCACASPCTCALLCARGVGVHWVYRNGDCQLQVLLGVGGVSDIAQREGVCVNMPARRVDSCYNKSSAGLEGSGQICAGILQVSGQPIIQRYGLA